MDPLDSRSNHHPGLQLDPLDQDVLVLCVWIVVGLLALLIPGLVQSGILEAT
jgi:hypothetical protein